MIPSGCSLATFHLVVTFAGLKCGSVTWDQGERGRGKEGGKPREEGMFFGLLTVRYYVNISMEVYVQCLAYMYIHVDDGFLSHFLLPPSSSLPPSLSHTEGVSPQRIESHN